MPESNKNPSGKKKILVIEDIAEMAELVRMYLESAGMEVSSCETAEDALQELSESAPDLILLDLNLPGMSGFQFLEKLKSGENKSVPVVIVSARDADEDIIGALGLGADEFVTKPFSPKVLVARVQANLRRNSGAEGGERKLCFGPYTMLLESCVLKKGAEKIHISQKEYEVLEFMARHEGENLTPEQIYGGVWRGQYGDISAVAVYIQRLRKKIEENPAEPKFLKTTFGMGYRFEGGSGGSK